MAQEPLNEQTAQAALEAFIERIPPCPPFEGTGVVIPGGGRYFPSAWVCLNMLRRAGCTLPIQVWHLGPDEMTPTMRRLAEERGASCVDAHAVRAEHPVRRLGGWELKAYAILRTGFRHVLLLDADNVPLVDPTFLFRGRQYAETGAIFWPDFTRFAPDHAIWRLTGVAWRDEPEFESGQICVDKERCWRAMSLALWMNEHSDFWYRHIYGDKDTFHLAFRKLGSPYAMPAAAPVHLDRATIAQADFAGDVIFHHRHGDKWRLDGANRAVRGFRDETACARFAGELVAQQATIEEELRVALAARLVTRAWSYERADVPPRSMSFLADGRIGEGAAPSERAWKADEEGLVILGRPSEVTCRLRRDDVSGGWSGHCVDLPRTPVRLVARAGSAAAVAAAAARPDAAARP
ncbi:MAG TPA: hypothetical protein VG389_25775 [Myxococcota bacterium]|jgi:hypothetical protein|nr:hypothetical protein [Myxococcota bacterium]